jgi:hypothetical protein
MIKVLGKKIEKSDLKRITPLAHIKYEKDENLMSLEWSDLNIDKIEVLFYLLKIETVKENFNFQFRTREELILAIQEIYEDINR